MFGSLLIVGFLGLSSRGGALFQGTGAKANEPSQAELEMLTSPAGPKSALPNLARGADDKLYLSWVDREGEEVGVLRFSVLEENGWGEPLEIMQGEDLFLNWADFPSVSALENGLLIAHWLREGDVLHGYTAEFSISSDRGRRWTAPKTLHSDLSPVEHGFVSIVPIDHNTFGAIWLDGRRTVGKAHGQGETGLCYRTISGSGELGDEKVLDPRVCDCCQTSLVTTSEGGLLATYRDRSPDEVRDISIARFDGRAWSEPEPVHVDGWLIAGCPVNGPRVAFAEGTAAVAWFTGVGEGGGNVLVAFQGAASTGFGPAIDVDDGRPVGRVDLLFLDQDSVIVSWMEDAGEMGAEWRVRRLWTDGRMGDSQAVAKVPFDRTSGYLRMATTGSDTVLAWTASDPERHVETLWLRTPGSSDDPRQPSLPRHEDHGHTR